MLRLSCLRTCGWIRAAKTAVASTIGHLGAILEGLRQTQLAEDERLLAKGRKTKREKALLSASIERRRAAVR